MPQSEKTYKHTGIDYGVLDSAKRTAQLIAQTTAVNLRHSGFSDVPDSRGESAYLIEHPEFFLAFNQEGLGTKNLVAETMERLTGKSYFESIAMDVVATVANDLITVGAAPLVMLQYLGTGKSTWFDNEDRTLGFFMGYKAACDKIGAVWGGGETPTLPRIIEKGTADLGGSGFGIISPKSRHLHGGKLIPGDAIVGIESSGIHANGLSLARELAGRLPGSYLTPIENGQTYGEALLTPTYLYSPLLQALFAEGIDVHYSANITGHGWRKIMRAKQPFRYCIDQLPPVPAVLSFIVDNLCLSPKEAYGTFNMGLGFAFFVAAKHAARTIEIANEYNFGALQLGTIEAAEESVLHLPGNITYQGHELGVRA